MSTGLASGLKKNLSQEDIKMLDRIYWRSFNVFAGFAGSAYAASLGYTYSIRPALDRFYPEQEKRAECMQRHMTPYNITQAVGTFAMGLAASMEKEAAANYGYATLKEIRGAGHGFDGQDSVNAREMSIEFVKIYEGIAGLKLR